MNAADPGRPARSATTAVSALGKVPPNSRQAEQSVLGCAMSGEIPLAIATATLKPEDFYSPDHRLVFDAVCALAIAQKPVDIITVSDYLESKNQLDLCGGLAYISSLPDMAPVIAHVDSYVDIVRQKAILRRLLTTMDEIRGLCFDDSDNADRLLDLSAKRIFDIRENRDQSGFSSMREIIAQTINDIHKIRSGEMQERSVKTGYATLDRVLGGPAVDGQNRAGAQYRPENRADSPRSLRGVHPGNIQRGSREPYAERTGAHELPSYPDRSADTI